MSSRNISVNTCDIFTACTCRPMKSYEDKKSGETTESSAKSETMQNSKEDTGTDHTGEVHVSVIYLDFHFTK